MATITFMVNLETPLRNSHVPVTIPSTLADAIRNSRSAWLPNELNDNHELVTHGATFTCNGHRAKYLKDNYTVGDYAMLSIVSEGMVFSEAGEVP